MGGQVSNNYSKLAINHLFIEVKESYSDIEENIYYLKGDITQDFIKFIESLGIGIDSREWSSREKFVISEEKRTHIYKFTWSYRLDGEYKISVIKFDPLKFYPIV